MLEPSYDGSLRLCIASANYHPVYSGAGLRFRRYGPAFRNRGVQVSICTGTPDAGRAVVSEPLAASPATSVGHFLPTEHLDGIPLHRVRLPAQTGLHRDAVFARSVARWCQDPANRPDVIQFVGNPLFFIPGLMRLRRSGIGIVAAETMMPRLPKTRARRIPYRAAVRFASRSVACVVASSGAMRDALRDIGVASRIEVIPHGVDTVRFRPSGHRKERGEVLADMGIPADADVLLFVGPVEPRKGVDLLLEAWSRLASLRPDVHLVVAGPRTVDPGPRASYQQELDALADRSGARHRVHFLGHVEDIPRLMRAADVFVFTSRREGMPNAMLEAMASGLPVVTTAFDGLSNDLGSPGREFVLSGFDAERFAEDVGALLGNAQHRAGIGRAARSWAEARLDIRQSVDAYVALYHEVAGRRSARAR
jgi:glycosyltransferase involved in cell wall biosynthesis